MNLPTIFTLEPIGQGGSLESDGTVRHFCNDGCLQQFIEAGSCNDLGNFVIRPDGEIQPGEVCTQCGKELTPAG